MSYEKNVRESFLIFKFCDDDGKKIETLKTSRKPQSMCGWRKRIYYWSWQVSWCLMSFSFLLRVFCENILFTSIKLFKSLTLVLNLNVSRIPSSIFFFSKNSWTNAYHVLDDVDDINKNFFYSIHIMSNFFAFQISSSLYNFFC